MTLRAVPTASNDKHEIAPKLRMPEETDGAAIWRLISESGSLDENSMYCNLLQCTHFASTCAVAELDGEIVGWVSGYIPPEQPDTLFIWQVCVSARARGLGLGKKLIQTVLARDVCKKVNQLQSTITDDNDASWALFGSIAKKFDAELTRDVHFHNEKHFDGAHDTEHLVCIGPFEREAAALRSAA